MKLIDGTQCALRVLLLPMALLMLAAQGAVAAPPAPVVNLDTIFSLRNLPSIEAACQSILDYLNSRNSDSAGHPCTGAFHVTACPTPGDVQPFSPVTSDSRRLQGLQSIGYYNYGNGYCQLDPAPLDWSIYESCPVSSFKYAGTGRCRCAVNQVESNGQCLSACPSGQKPEQGSCVTVSAPKNNGACGGLGNPCNPGTGIKSQREEIYRSAAPFGFEFSLNYNSRLIGDPLSGWKGVFGNNWISSFERKLTVFGDGMVTARRMDGKEWEFRPPSSGNRYLGDHDISDILDRLVDGSNATTGWKLTAANGDEVETYSAAGRLQSVTNRNGLVQTYAYSVAVAGTPTNAAQRAGLVTGVTDAFGRQVSLYYDANERIARATDLAAHDILFEYDGPSGGCPVPGGSEPGCSANNLTKVTRQDGATRIYWYNEASHINGGASCPGLPNGLVNHFTGITDENGNRFATYEYDCLGRGIATFHAGNVDRYAFTFNPNGTTTVVDPLGTSRTFGFQNILGVVKSAAVDLPCSGCGAFSAASATYDINGNPQSRIDWNGNRSNYTYDLARNLETSRTEGLTSAGGATPQTRTITTEWHATLRLATRIAEPLRITTNVYDPDGTQCGARGALCSKSIQATTDANGAQGFSATPSGAPRTWTYTYNANGSPLTVNGPRTDVSDLTTYTYYANNDADLGKRGNVATITNAAGHLTSITAYNADGQPTTIIDPNGMTITLTYDERQRLKSRDSGGEVTRYDYDGVGQLTMVTLPDLSYLSYSYDPAHRLTGVADNLGNSITYTLDAMGNRTLDRVFDPANVLAQKRSRVYNNLNRLFQEVGAQNQTTEYAYDDQGNVTSVKDPLNHITSNQYDTLNRLKQVTDPNLGVTQYAYNGLDALTQVTDPRSLITSYTLDGLDNLTHQASPDSGMTDNTYDTAGNLLRQTDAKGQLTTYVYDALNRVTSITFHDGSKQTYAYDQGTNGIGRLSSITETNPANQVTSQIAYAYELHGRVSTETRTINGVQYFVGYTYDNAGRLSGMSYPSGRTLTYTFDALGRVSQVSTAANNQSQIVVQNVAYHPFGGVTGFTLGNGQAYTRSIDLDGRIASYTLGAQSFGVGYDAASRIEFISDLGTPANSNNYGYDSLDRLTSAVTPATPYAYSYDAVGNRTSRSAGASTDTYAYNSSNNRIASITPTSGPLRSFVFDANGSTTADGNNTYGYDTRGRMVQATSSLGTTTYQVNALGQRIRKTNSLGDIVFHYDTGGRLIAETDPAGALKREVIYLGDIPVGVVQ